MNLAQAFPQIIQKAKSTRNSSIPQLGDRNHGQLVIQPLQDHKQTFVLLHGRGDEARWFGGGLLDAEIPTYKTLGEAFPDAKFIFPQAPERKCARQPGFVQPQWFDNWGYDKSAEDKEDLKVEGLQETTKMVHAIVEEEIAIVGADNIVLGGLSQGCAASMIALLLWSGQPLAGYFGMCGHLPFRAQLEDCMRTASEGKEDAEIVASALSWLRQKLDLPSVDVEVAPFLQTPIFTAHGDQDKVVPTPFGRDAARCLQSLGARSIYREYEGLVHWYNAAMLHDFVAYLKTNTTWEVGFENQVTAL